MRKQALILAIVVVCLFGLFAFYEVVVRDEFTWIVFYQWHRLFLAAGYLIIGAVAFLGGRPVVSLAVSSRPRLITHYKMRADNRKKKRLIAKMGV